MVRRWERLGREMVLIISLLQTAFLGCFFILYICKLIIAPRYEKVVDTLCVAVVWCSPAGQRRPCGRAVGADVGAHTGGGTCAGGEVARRAMSFHPARWIYRGGGVLPASQSVCQGLPPVALRFPRRLAGQRCGALGEPRFLLGEHHRVWLARQLCARRDVLA